MNQMMSMMHLDSDKAKKSMVIALSTAGGVAMLGVAAAAVWNSKQMRMSRAVKRTGKVLYQVGTAMRNVSGVSDLD